MSKIEKLSITGVRSFDHKSQMAISFKTPLTLIVGMNGSGKTTIIECLKYVTTGEMPPNSEQGRSFVHDPKMAGEKEVLAQVKLQYTSTEGMRMVTTRNMSLTVKQGKRTFKSLEGTIKMAKDGERSTVSSTVADINGMMPRYLGVSKAVLENVIFCHQEESLWPMMAPTDLKKKFDEIFEANKYTKAIDNIKVMQKNKKIELKNLELNEVHCKQNNDKKKNLKAKIGVMDKQCETLREQEAQFRAQRLDAEQEYQDAANRFAEVNVVVGELKNKRSARAAKEENVQGLRENLNEMSESDNDLQRMLDEYDEHLRSFDANLQEQKKLYHQKEAEVTSARNVQSAKVSAIGRFEEQKASHERQVEYRNRLIQESARTHEIRGYDRDIDERLAKEFMQKITRTTRDAQAEFERVRSQVQEEVSTQQKVLNNLNSEAVRFRQQKESSRLQINKYDEKIGEMQRRAQTLHSNESDKVTFESQLSDTQSKLTTAKSEMDSAPWNKQIESAEAELRRLADAREKLDSEREEAARRAKESAQIDYLREQLEDRNRRLGTMTSAHGDRVREIVGDGWKPQTLENSYEHALKNLDTEVADAKKQRDGSQIQADNLSSKLDELKASLKAKKSEAKDAENDIYNAIGRAPKDFPTELAEREQNRDDLKQEGDSLGMIQQYFEAAIKMAKKPQKPCCRMCTRPFANQTELQAMLDRVKLEQDNMTQQIDEQKIAEAETALEQARKVNAQFDTWERLTQKEVPAVVKDIEDVERRWKQANDECEAHSSVFKEAASRKQDVESLSKTVNTIVTLSSEADALHKQIEKQAAKQKSQGLSRGFEAVQADIKKIDSESKTQQASRDEAVSIRDRKTKAVSDLELEASRLEGKLQQALYDLKQRKDLEEQEQEYKTLKSQEREKIQEFDRKLSENASQTATEQAKYDDISRRGADKDRDQQNKFNKLNSSLNKLSTADADIKGYYERGGDEQLLTAKREKEDADAAVDRAVGEQSQITRNIKKLTDQSQSYAESKRNITDNQRYRRDRRQLQQLSDEIEELEKRNCEADARTYQREAERWQKKRDEAAAQQAAVVGELKGVDSQLQISIAEFARDYKTAGRQYKAAHIMVTTTKAAIQDLGAYGAALDKAIMQYHTMKMEQINGIIDELWRKTYMGTDVDTIMIRSENETVKSTKNYNYRVVMVKQDTEMDMRGRCSAGQKVLASIIIRMALAECFGIRCGVIALDEPTTNLDVDNIRALALSLSAIIQDRKKQANFQLIIITHDEDFLREMRCDDLVDSYYRVHRNNDQNTEIAKQSIAEVM
ncbi:DNA repair protein RAD50 [Pseudocercospora fuligena]|uniref:DNA repair protein RAD50 n=1 Tax=Pseudocercospora fuligena TaxID=685502 RepID=A0A8H6VFC6_9PEZI|nr:DNA repair protein RAD50 [Pseudocercospora fuligena]